MNDIYNKAIEEQGAKGRPIFYVKANFYRTIRHGNSKKIKKEFFNAKVVLSGTLEQMKREKKSIFSCLKTEFSKAEAMKADLNQWFIDSIEVLSFHGYSHHK